jgi:hypothetical protein
MFIPLAFFLLVIVGVVLFFVLAGKKKAEGEDLGDHAANPGNEPFNNESQK